MPSAQDLLQMMIALLSVPVVAAALGWLARRFSKEARLTIRLERLATIFPNLPEGAMQDEFGKRVAEAGAELNARLDPLFKRERRRKRKVFAWLAMASAFLALVFPGHAALGDTGSTTISVILGAAGVAAFLFIERDTRRQRAAIATEQGSELPA
jgi:Flp pilus assembly protein TadB